MTTSFKEHQTGWVGIIPMVLVVILITVLYSLQLGTRPISTSMYLLFFAISGVAVSLFYRMQTEVKSDEVTIEFGLGVIRKRIPINNITSVAEVKNPWYYGWGIRIIPGGWLYTMSGSNAVELNLKSGRIIRIGTRKSAELFATLNEMIRKTT